MHQVRVRASMASALCEGEMLVIICVVYPLRGESLNRFGQQVRVVWRLHVFRYFGLRALGGMDDEGLAFDQRPLY